MCMAGGREQENKESSSSITTRQLPIKAAWEALLGALQNMQQAVREPGPQWLVGLQ